MQLDLAFGALKHLTVGALLEADHPLLGRGAPCCGGRARCGNRRASQVGAWAQLLGAMV